jgi:signal transduction histidine kinase
MSLSTFIREHQEEIIVEFAIFARTLMPSGAEMSEADLRDHAQDMLAALLEDLRTGQTSEEQARKSKGHGSARAMELSGKLHADHRIEHGFTFRAVLAEFRALRATVLRLYEESGASDLQEVRRFNEAVDEALTESMERFAEKTDLFRDQFIGILSHDLRGPLGAVVAGTALLAAPEDNPQRRGRVVARMMRSAQRMERMIGDLLDLTRARLGGTIPLSRRQADLQKLCEEVVLESRATHPAAEVLLNTKGNLLGIWDGDRLAQVISNLVGNALQHGEGTPVTVTAQEEGDEVSLVVHNGGKPIPPEVMPSVFEPLARGDSKGDVHSIGLGLFIARMIVAAHGGAIGVTSSREHGTTFTARLPKLDSTDSAASVPATH